MYRIISKMHDADAGLSEDDDVEEGYFITMVSFSEATIELPNKIAMARIEDPTLFFSTVALSLAVEVAVKVAVMCWFRNKGIAEDLAMEMGVLEGVAGKGNEREGHGEEAKAEVKAEVEDKNETPKRLTVLMIEGEEKKPTSLAAAASNSNWRRSLRKAAHRHGGDANDMKRYEFRM